MKISINLSEINAPWGGGNRFIKSFSKFFIQNGHEVTNDLSDKDIDIIFLMDPRPNHPQSNYSLYQILKYIKNIKEDTIIVHRINECDERKKTNFINNLLLNCNYFTDHTVLVGSWLKDLKIMHSNNFDNYSVILNGADETIFKSYLDKKILNNEVNLVTHHWSNNYYKGFDIYSHIDKNIAGKIIDNHKINFTYIGNLPKKIIFQNTRVLDPLDGNDLVDILNMQNIYITASLNEPGGNHQNEGAACGLPILYRNSGCLPEYCANYGVEFNTTNFDIKLKEIINNYEFYLSKIQNYPNISSNMNRNYLKLFAELINNKKEIIKKRQFIKNNLNNKLKFFNFYLSLL